MLIHKKIRDEITGLLQTRLGIDALFSAGRPAFLDLDNDPTAVAVFIDEAIREEITTCDAEWTATLSIAVYRKSLTGEAELDEIAENIVNILQRAEEEGEIETLGNLTLTDYNYEQDTQQRTWYIASLQYQIKYTN